MYSVDENGIMLLHRGEGIQLSKHEVFECTLTLPEALKLSDVVVSGVPSPTYKIDASMMKEGVVAINFSTFKNMDDDVKQKASIFVPSVGKVTVSMLQRNLLRLYQYLNETSLQSEGEQAKVN